MYGKVIDDRFKGYLPIGDYVKQNDFNTFKDTIKTGIQSALKEQENGFLRITNNLQPKGDYVTLSQFNSYTKDADTKFNNLFKFAGTTEQTIREFNQLKTELKPAFEEIEGRARRDYLTKDEFNQLKTELKPAFNELNGRMEKYYLTKEEFESFKQKLMASTPSINTAFTPVTKLPPPSYLRHKNYMHY